VECSFGDQLAAHLLISITVFLESLGCGQSDDRRGLACAAKAPSSLSRRMGAVPPDGLGGREPCSQTWLDRSRMRSRSNSARAAMMLRMSLPLRSPAPPPYASMRLCRRRGATFCFGLAGWPRRVLNSRLRPRWPATWRKGLFSSHGRTLAAAST